MGFPDPSSFLTCVALCLFFVSLIHYFSSISVVCLELERILLPFVSFISSKKMFLGSGVGDIDPQCCIISIYVLLSVTCMTLHCFVRMVFMFFFSSPKFAYFVLTFSDLFSGIKPL